MASETLKQAFRTDVGPLLAQARAEAGGAIAPIAAYRASLLPGQSFAETRPASQGTSGGIV